MRRFFGVFLLALMMISAYAVPAKRGVTRLITLTDGTTVSARLVGDEHGHYWLAADGKAYQAVGDAGTFCEVDAAQVRNKAKVRRSQSNSRRVKRLAPRRVGVVNSFTGEKKGLIILVNFKDTKFKNAHNNALYQRIANEEDFKYDKFVGSVYDYFRAQSDGQFLLNFDVLGPVEVSREQAYYGKNDKHGSDLYAATMVIEALKLIDEDVNFADYDWDGDDEVDQVYVIYAGKGEADGGDDDTIWPHEYTLDNAHYYGDGEGSQTLDGVKIDTYACGSELNGSGTIAGIGTLCHEFSHCLGYPDFYDTDYSGGQGMGYWDLMDSGSYNDDGYQPAGYTSYERWVAGWKTPTELSADTTVTDMKALQEGGECFIIYNSGNPDEYFLLENRQKTGWDESLPGKGLLILHVDYDATAWEYNQPNDDPNHQRMTWIPADNEYQYSIYQGTKYYKEEGMATDTYPYGLKNSFSRSTTPAAKFYNKTTNGSYYLDAGVMDIQQNSDGTIAFSFTGNDSGGTGDASIFKLVKNVSDLVDGARCIIACGTKEKAAGEMDNNVLPAVDVTIQDNQITDNGELLVLTLVKKTSGYAFVNEEGNYLYSTTTRKLSYSSLEKTWTLSNGSKGVIMTFGSNGTIQYNSRFPRFTTYSSGQSEANLYMEVPAYEMTLSDGSDNNSEIAAHKNERCNVTLSNRTLFKDGSWNTLCLPFDLTVAGSVLSGADVRELTSGSFDHTTGVLTLRFTTTSVIKAGQPYLIKWAEGDNIQNPTFKGVTITSTEPTTVTFDDGRVKFMGIFSPTDIYREDRSNLYLGSSNKLIYAAGESVSSFSLNAFRAYFNVDGANSVRSFKLDLSDETTTGIADKVMTREAGSPAVFNLSGQRIAQPGKGLYIRDGKKLVVK